MKHPFIVALLLATCLCAACEFDHEIIMDEACTPETYDCSNGVLSSCMNYDGVVTYWKPVAICQNGCAWGGRACYQKQSCARGYDLDGSCTCNESCVSGCNDSGYCLCKEQCKFGCDQNLTGQECTCSDQCPNLCNKDGSCPSGDVVKAAANESGDDP